MGGGLRGPGWEVRGSACRAGRGLEVCPRGSGRDLTEPGHSHCSWGHLWHLLWPQAVPMLPQQSSCLVEGREGVAATLGGRRAWTGVTGTQPHPGLPPRALFLLSPLNLGHPPVLSKPISWNRGG